MTKKLPLLIVLVSLSLLCFGQDQWQQVKDQDGIKVYTRRLNNEKFKEIKVDFDVDATEDQLIGVIKNITHAKDWSYGTKRTFLIQKKGKDTIIYYSEVSLPWPLSNRDLVIELSFKRDTLNKMLHIQAKSIPGFVPKNPDLVRVPYSVALWDVKVRPDKKLEVQYTLSTDPGGALPAWLVNLAASTGPYNSFRKLRVLLKKSSP